MNSRVFCCKGKKLANFLIKNGSKLIRIDNDQNTKGYLVFIFVNDDSIERNLAKWNKEKERWLF